MMLYIVNLFNTKFIDYFINFTVKIVSFDQFCLVH